MLAKEKLERQLGQRTGVPPFLTTKEENEQRHKMIVLNESNVISANIDKFTFMLGKPSTKNRQAKPFKPRVYKGRYQPLTNSGIGD